MTETSLDLVHSLLVHVADFLKKLPTDQVHDLLSGEARLAVIPKGARIGAGATSRTSRATASAVDSAQVAADLSRINDRTAATQYVTDLKLTVAQLKQLCKELDIPVSSKATKGEYVSTIVGLLVGRRADSDALQRHAGAR